MYFASETAQVELKVGECKSLPATRQRPKKILAMSAMLSYGLSYTTTALEASTVSRSSTTTQGLTLVRFSAQLEPFLTQNTP